MCWCEFIILVPHLQYMKDGEISFSISSESTLFFTCFIGNSADLFNLHFCLALPFYVQTFTGSKLF